MTPQELQDMLDELEASRASRKRAWENLAEIRWVIKDTVGIELPPPVRKTIDLEGRIVKDGVKKARRDRQLALAELVHAIRAYREDCGQQTADTSVYRACRGGWRTRPFDLRIRHVG